MLVADWEQQRALMVRLYLLSMIPSSVAYMLFDAHRE